MKQTTRFSILLYLAITLLCSCSNDDEYQANELGIKLVDSSDKQELNFNAKLSNLQEKNLATTGSVFLPEQQKDSWNNIIPKDVPSSWGIFQSLQKPQTKAAGVGGAYQAQYWTMIRLKTGSISSKMRRVVNAAVKEIESKTNIRFYNSQKDPEYLEPYHIKLPNVFVTYSSNSKEGSGSFGLVGGEQYILIPKELDNSSYSYKEVQAFLMHAFCNAAGMFNEQQRKDRDDYVDIYWKNIKDGCKEYFNKQNKNYTMVGYFDYNSITMASSKAYSKNGNNTIMKKGGGTIAKNLTLSELDIHFLNEHYLPYVARTDNYTELDKIVYKNGKKLTEEERLDLQRRINQQRGLYGELPADGRIKRKPW